MCAGDVATLKSSKSHLLIVLATNTDVTRRRRWEYRVGASPPTSNLVKPSQCVRSVFSVCNLQQPTAIGTPNKSRPPLKASSWKRGLPTFNKSYTATIGGPESEHDRRPLPTCRKKTRKSYRPCRPHSRANSSPLLVPHPV